MKIHVLRHADYKELIFGMSSVCLSVDTITQKIIELAQPKFGMRSYMIKISVGIAYEQNRPTGVASALRAQFGFWVKSALKMHCTKKNFRQK